MEVRAIEPQDVYTTRLVKSEDLNHHGTLFAGRTAEWFVESGFIAAANLVDPRHIVCLKIHGMHFTSPVKPGQILKFVSSIVYAGRSSMVAYIEVEPSGMGKPFVSGFITFIYVDKDTHPTPHGIQITPLQERDRMLYESARNLHKNQ